MCGRARQALAPEEVAVAAGVAQQRWVDRDRYRPSHNAAPGAWMPVVRVAQDGQRTLQTMRWGLVPSFHKASEKADHYRMFNARCETVDSKGIFKRLLAHKRCVVPLQGFYEWKAEAGGKKQPYYASLSGDKPMLMAGLFDAYTDEEGQKVHTYTILTTDSSKRLEWLHDRMPVILQNEQEAAAWLGEGALPGAAKEGAEAAAAQAAAEKGDHETAKNAGSAEEAATADAELPDEEAQHEDEKSKEEYAAAIAKGAQLVNKLARPYNNEDLVWWPVTAAMGKMSYQGDDAWKDMRAAKGAISNFFKPTGVVKSSKGKGGATAAAAGAGAAGEGGAAGSKPEMAETAGAAGETWAAGSSAGTADAAGAAAQARVGETAGTAGTAGQRLADAKAAAGTGNQGAAATAPGSKQEQQQQAAAGEAVRNTDDTNAARESGDEAAEVAKPAAEAEATKKAVGTGRTRAAGKAKAAGKAGAEEKAEASGPAGEGAVAGKGAAGGRKRAASAAAAVAEKGAATAVAPRKRAKRA